MILGIVFGLLTAASQSVYYLLSRHYTHQEGRGSLELLVRSHLWTAALALPTLCVILLTAADLPPWRTWIGPCCAAAGFYLAGHTALFVALRHGEPSRISPMLGLKVVMLAAISATWLDQDLGPAQWLAVGLSVAAAFVLNYTGGALARQASLAALGACLGYSLSDLGIRALNFSLAEPVGPTLGPIVGCCLSLSICGLVALALLPVVGRGDWPSWRDSGPVGATWFLAMIFLFTTFYLVDVVLGNILQATRGLQSILMAVLVAHWGWEHLEPPMRRGVLWRRIMAAVLMVAAVALYLLF